MKVFAIGFNKTGTVSMHSLFEELKLRSFHSTRWRACDDLELLLKHQCFSDGPAGDFRFLDWVFPNAKFILNVRQLNFWIFSRLLLIERQKQQDPDFVHWLTWDPTTFAVNSWILDRNRYHLDALRYFAGRTDFLVVNFPRDPNAANRICRFLGFEGEYVKPRANVHSSGSPTHRPCEILRQSVQDLNLDESDLFNDLLCPSLLAKRSKAKWPVDSRELDRFTMFVGSDI